MTYIRDNHFPHNRNIYDHVNWNVNYEITMFCIAFMLNNKYIWLWLNELILIKRHNSNDPKLNSDQTLTLSTAANSFDYFDCKSWKVSPFIGWYQAPLLLTWPNLSLCMNK